MGELKRRMRQIGSRLYRVELPGNDTSTFSYRERSILEPNPGFERFALYWDSVWVDNFLRREDLLCMIIRFAYGIKQEHLIPSEILADFSLVYEAGDWVDKWYCPDEHQVIFAFGEPKRPGDRNIRMFEITRNAFQPKKRKRGFVGRILALVPEPPRMPTDEECLLTLKSGRMAISAYEAKKREFLDLRK